MVKAEVDLQEEAVDHQEEEEEEDLRRVEEEILIQEVVQVDL